MFEKIREILCQYTEVDEAKIDLDSNLQYDLDLNSFDVLNIIVEFEDIFNVEIADTDVRAFITVRDIEEYLISLVNKDQ